MSTDVFHDSYVRFQRFSTLKISASFIFYVLSPHSSRVDVSWAHLFEVFKQHTLKFLDDSSYFKIRMLSNNASVARLHYNLKPIHPYLNIIASKARVLGM